MRPQPLSHNTRLRYLGKPNIGKEDCSIRDADGICTCCHSMVSSEITLTPWPRSVPRARLAADETAPCKAVWAMRLGRGVGLASGAHASGGDTVEACSATMHRPFFETFRSTIDCSATLSICRKKEQEAEIVGYPYRCSKIFTSLRRSYGTAIYPYCPQIESAVGG